MSEEAEKPAEDLKAQVQEVLDQIRPALQMDGGDIELVDVDSEGYVLVRLQGACAGCPMSSMTLAMGVERNLKEKVPAVKGVVPV